jgi:beta-galactosidase
VIVPAYELVDSALVAQWTRYAANGGNLIITCRTGMKDRNGHFWEGEIAAPISQLIGAHINAFDMLPGDTQGVITYSNATYNWNNWADLLDADKGTEILATYSNQFYAGKAAVVKHNIGKGTVTYIGVDTDDSKLERDVLKSVFAQNNVAIEDYPEGIYVNWRAGIFVAVNYSSDSKVINIPEKAKILIGEKTLAPAGVVVWTLE